MRAKEREQLEALETYLLHSWQKAKRNMLKADTIPNSEYYKGRFGVFQEAYYLLHDFLDGRLQMPEQMFQFGETVLRTCPFLRQLRLSGMLNTLDVHMQQANDRGGAKRL